MIAPYNPPPELTKPPLSAVLLTFLKQILNAETIEDILDILASWSMNQDYDIIMLRRCELDEHGIPRLDIERFRRADFSTTEPWTQTIYVDDESLASVWILSGGPPIFIEDIAEFALFTDASREFHRQQGIVSVYHVLLQRQGNPVAVMSVMWRVPQQFTDIYKAVIEFAAWALSPVVENIYLGRQVDDLKQIILNLEQQVIASETALHALAHDIKQPISNIILSANMLDSYLDRLNRDQITERVKHITSAGIGINDWINSVMLLAEARREQVIDLQPIDMKVLISHVLQNMELTLIQFNATVRFSAALEILPPILGYRVWVEHVWANLIINACKYGDSPVEIQLDAQRETMHIRFMITNNGEPIPADKLEYVFDPFVRLHMQKKQRSGSGIGLTTVRMMVQKMKGQVGAQSENQSNTFWFTLPVADTHLTSAP